MLRIDMTARTLANTRFVISPLHITTDALWLTRPPARPSRTGWGPMVRDALREHRLVLLHSLFAGSWRYLPDFLQPEPQSHQESMERELHGVVTTDPGRIAAELALMLSGSTELRLAGGAAQRPLLEAMERGEQAFAELVAGELHQLWESVVSPRWPSLRARAENDIAHRIQTVGRHGLGNGLGTLHPWISWHDDHLRMAVDFHGEIEAPSTLTLMPSVFSKVPHSMVDPLHERGDCRTPILMYPALPLPGSDRPPGPPAGDLMGETRALLLADLATGRSTTELAERHRLAASTVSYHLGVLFRSGLLTRTRADHRVLYRQSARALEVF
ncbi:ArsR/SmtB family transcription factor [Kitasatospora sp. NPDC101801]|uniref:ArsR/SmtB family transcription factor n=1 Tax=Kitasatospora sp. NPDC101801 TaxID=3364103 RepID=UPI003825FD7E